MSDLLICGMEMPKDIEPGLVIEFADGIDGKRYARLYHYRHGGLTEWLETVPVPPHGRLGDLDEMEKKYSQCLVGDAYGLMPTIIPASQPIDADYWGEEYAEAKGFDNASAEDSMT